MLASTLRYHKTQEEANEIAALRMRLYANPVSAIPAMKAPFIWDIRGCWWSTEFHFTFICEGSGFTLCHRLRVSAAFLAVYNLGQIRSQRPCPHNITVENSARSGVQYGYVKPWLSAWPQRNHPQDESKRGLGCQGCFFFVSSMF